MGKNIIAFAAALACGVSSAADARSMAFTVGALIPDGADLDTGVPAPGYPPALAPLYENLPDRAMADALGLGAFGIVPDHRWYWTYRRQPPLPRRNMPQLRRSALSGLPVTADLAPLKGSHNWLSFMEGVNPPGEAWIQGAAEGFPYSFATHEGIALWRAIWRNGAEWFAREGAAPESWLLMRNADWWDEGVYARREFARYIAARHKDAAGVQAAFGAAYRSAAAVARARNPGSRLMAEAARFHEEKFNGALAEAARVLSRDADAPAAVFFQPARLDARGVDVASAAALCTPVAAPAEGAGRVFTALFLRAAAGAQKPLALVGMRVPPSRGKLRDALLAQFARGYTRIWLSDWRGDVKARLRHMKNAAGRTVRDDAATEAASRALAAARPSSILNPYATPPGALDGINDARAVIAGLEPLFTVENRARGTGVALLRSRSAERVAGSAGAPPQQITNDGAAEALMNLHVKAAVVFEDALSALTNGAGFRVLVATDSSWTAPPGALSNITAFAAAGGRVLLTQNALLKNEYGGAPSGADIPGAVRIGAENFSADLAAALSEAGAEPFCQCLDAATGAPLGGVEIWHAEAPDGESALMVFNRRGAEARALINGAAHTLAPDACVVVRTPAR